MTKYKVGDKVVPISKSVWGGLGESEVFSTAEKLGLPYLFITGYDAEEGAYACDYERSDGGDFFAESDLIPYVADKPTKKQRITELEAKVAELEAKFDALKEALQ